MEPLKQPEPTIIKIDGLHLIQRINPDGDKFWTDHVSVTTLKQRGWSTELIDVLLGPAEKERHRGNQHGMRLFKAELVVKAEKTKAFRDHKVVPRGSRKRQRRAFQRRWREAAPFCPNELDRRVAYMLATALRLSDNEVYEAVALLASAFGSACGRTKKLTNGTDKRTASAVLDCYVPRIEEIAEAWRVKSVNHAFTLHQDIARTPPKLPQVKIAKRMPAVGVGGRGRMRRDKPTWIHEFIH